MAVKRRASVKSPDTGHHGGRSPARSARNGVITVTIPALSNGTGRSTIWACTRKAGKAIKAPIAARRRMEFIGEIGWGMVVQDMPGYPVLPG